MQIVGGYQAPDQGIYPEASPGLCVSPPHNRKCRSEPWDKGSVSDSECPKGQGWRLYARALGHRLPQLKRLEGVEEGLSGILVSVGAMIRFGQGSLLGRWCGNQALLVAWHP